MKEKKEFKMILAYIVLVSNRKNVCERCGEVKDCAVVINSSTYESVVICQDCLQELIACRKAEVNV